MGGVRPLRETDCFIQEGKKQNKSREIICIRVPRATVRVYTLAVVLTLASENITESTAPPPMKKKSKIKIKTMLINYAHIYINLLVL